MTKRSEEKAIYLAALRGDAKAQRTCTEKGKSCGGRCIPKHWNCRIKGEGETPPTRGNAVQLSAEQKQKIQKARSRRRTRRALTALGGAAAVGAAVAGAAAIGAKNPAKARRMASKLARGGASEALGVASAIGGPVAAGVAGVANLGVAGFQVGARMGAGVAQRRRALTLFKKLTRQRVQLTSQLKTVRSAAQKAQSKVIKAQEKVATQQKIVDAAKIAAANKGQRRSGYALGQNPQSIAQTDQARKNNLKRAEAGLRKANSALNAAQKAYAPRKVALESLERKISSVSWKASKLKTGLTSASNPIRNTLSSSLSASRSSFRSGRRQVSGFIRYQGRRGPKADPRSWQERFGMDEAEREDKKCGNSGIPDNAKCTKKNTARTIAKAAAGAALITGGAAALKNRRKVASRFRKRGLTNYQKQALERMKAKGTGKYGARARRSFTSNEMPYYSEADRPRPLYDKRLFKKDLEYRGEEFAGYNKPKRTPDHPKKSHAVLAKEGGTVKLIRFGQQGVKGSPKKEGESKAYAARRRAFKARHASNIKKGKMSAAYWANRSKW